MRTVAGKRKKGCVLSIVCVCRIVSVSVFAGALQARVTYTFGYPIPYAHWSKNQSRSRWDTFSMAIA